MPQNHSNPSVLIVDPDAASADALLRALGDACEVQVISDVARALRLIGQPPGADLVLVSMDGDLQDTQSACEKLSAALRATDGCLLAVTKQVARADAALAAGAADVLLLPLPDSLVQARVVGLLRERRKARDLEQTVDVCALAVATLTEMRDSETLRHILRVQSYVQVLLDHLAKKPAFRSQLTRLYRRTLVRAVPLYDIGTAGVPDRILLKPDTLTPTELAIMQTHTVQARAAFEQAQATLGVQPVLLDVVKDIVHAHQEKWDGSGYPQGLAGDQIPFSARVVALADVYDALISNKVYKDGVPHDQAVQVIFSERGAHFDPDLVDAFIEVQDEFAAIAQRHADTDDDMQRKMEYMANAIAENAEL